MGQIPSHHMSGPDDFKLGRKHNAGDPEGRRVMRDKSEPPIVKPEDILWLIDGSDGSSTFGDAARPPVPVADGACQRCGGVGCVACDARAVPVAEPVASEPVAILQKLREWAVYWSEFNPPCLSAGDKGWQSAAAEVLAMLDARPPVAPVASKSVEAVMREIENFVTVSMVYGGKGVTVCQTREHVQAAIVAYGDAQWNAGRDAAANHIASGPETWAIIDAIRGLKR